MPANKYALLRYRIIDKCIRNKYKPYPTKEDLRTACEESLYGSGGERISESTIEKDLWAMRYEGDLGYYAPIRFSKRDRGYFYEDENYSIDSIPLNDDDVDALKFAATTLYQFKDIDVFRQFDFAIEKIFDRLNITPNVEDEAVTRFVQFETVPQVGGSEYLGTLLQCIKEGKEISFDYQPFQKREISTYNLDPYLLKEYRNRWYLIGYHQSREAFLTFGLDRIRRVDPTEESFQTQDGFDPDKYFKHSIGITAQNDQEPVDVVLAFSPMQGKYIKSQPLHGSQKLLMDTEKEVRISLHVLPTIELEMQILGYGPGVQVLEPPFLREKIRKQIVSTLDQY